MFELIPWRRRGSEMSPSIGTLRNEIDDLFSRFFGRETLSAQMPRGFYPAIDLAENAKEFSVKAEIPGMDSKKLDISLTGEMLTIKGEKNEEKEEKGKNFHRVERSFGSFSRSFRLPIWCRTRAKMCASS